ncbi:MAG: helix-turn-helix transcriptional regulator [Methanotrichaceae archaeon]
MKVLLCLKDENKNIGELVREIGFRNTTILHAINRMIKSDTVTRIEHGYKLTNLGKIQACFLDDMINLVTVLEEHKNFWLTHDMSGIPTELLKKIGMLAQSDIITSDYGVPLKAQENFISELMKSKEIHGVSPINIPGYSDAITIPIKNGAKVDLILTEDILEIISKEYHNLTRKLLECDNFKLYKIDASITVAFTVTDSLLSLGLYRLDGYYDLGNDLICRGEYAVAWGLELFEYYRKRSELITHI